MCTAISYKMKTHYFGRNLDLEYHYKEEVVITPRKYPFRFRCADTLDAHYAMIGMATVADRYPLYYDATNKYGLSMAGLNFPGNAVYYPPQKGKQNIAPFEFIPWILSQCQTISHAKDKIKEVNLCQIPFSSEFPLTPLHWIIADQKETLTVESVTDGLKIYQNPVHVLTNSPPFDYHMYNITNYLALTKDKPNNNFSDKLKLTPYSNGMGAIGLPGDLSSASRFIRAAFTLHNSVCDGTDESCINQFFHILQSVAQTRGCAKIGDAYEKTVYSSCCNTSRGIYYYTTYENSRINGIDMHAVDLSASKLKTHPLLFSEPIPILNK